jgi:hypothetical protein
VETVFSGFAVTPFSLSVADPDVGVNFAVLLIVRLRRWSVVELTGTLFRAGLPPEAADVIIEQPHGDRSVGAFYRRLFDVLRCVR